MTSTFWTLNVTLKELPSIASQPTQDNTVITRVSLHGHESSMDPHPRPTCTMICSAYQLLNLEILNIKRFASWNGFPRRICDKLIDIYTSRIPKATHNEKVSEPTIPIIWVKLPFIRKKGKKLYPKDFLLDQTTGEICELLGNYRKQHLHFSKISYTKTLQIICSV